MKKNRKRWYPEEGIPGKFLRKMKLILFLCWADTCHYRLHG